MHYEIKPRFKNYPKTATIKPIPTTENDLSSFQHISIIINLPQYQA